MAIRSLVVGGVIRRSGSSSSANAKPSPAPVASSRGPVTKREKPAAPPPAVQASAEVPPQRPSTTAAELPRENPLARIRHPALDLSKIAPLGVSVVLRPLDDVEDEALGFVLPRALGETGFPMKKRIGRLVRGVGPEVARELYARAREIEAAGGELVEKEARRRTSGGLFVKLVQRRSEAEGNPLPRRPRPPPCPAPPVPQDKTEGEATSSPDLA